MGEILIVLNVLSASGLPSHPKHQYARYMADIDTAAEILRSDLAEMWQYNDGSATKILLLFNGSSKEFVGNPVDINTLKSVLLL